MTNELIIEHFMSVATLETLAPIFMKPVDHHGHVDWIAPAWWYLAYATAKS